MHPGRAQANTAVSFVYLIAKLIISGLEALIVLLAVALSASASSLDIRRSQQSGVVQAVQDLIKRRIPAPHSSAFTLQLIPVTSGSLEYFKVDASNGTVTFRGLALASALNWYLREVVMCQFTWLDEQLTLPAVLPAVVPTYYSSTPFLYRYYYNVCTYGYTTVWWDWARWEREIDWMAMNGINMPLAFNGQEYVWAQVFSEFGVSLQGLSDFFTGPAFLPWQRMGNVNGWGGPLPGSWINSQRILQLQILQRMRALGMSPVLPGFAGHVPGELQTLHPSAKITQLGKWAGFNGTFFLDPSDPLFSDIGAAFIKKQTAVYGTDHLYNADPFNELVPPTNDPTYLANTAKTIYASMAAEDPKAIWVLQGWFLHNNQNFWKPPQTKAFLGAVPSGGLVVLDLYAEIDPVWTETESFYGTPFIWNMLHNFGGRSGLYGTMPRVVAGPLAALSDPSASIVGIGLTPEATETNYVVYELAMDLVWRNASQYGDLNLNTWVSRYAIRRYGVNSQAITKAWALLQNSVYNCTSDQEGTSGSVIAARPLLSMSRVGCCAPIPLYYNPNDVYNAWKLLLQASTENPTLSDLDSFKNDIVDVTKQVLSDMALVLYQSIITAYNNRQITPFAQNSNQLLSVIDSMDQILATQQNFMLSLWINRARALGPTPADADLYELNARTQITLWGPMMSTLQGYAYKLWSGLVSDFYKPRWKLFVTQLQIDLAGIRPFNQTAFTEQCQLFEEGWTRLNNKFPSQPVGNAVEVSQQIFKKYSALAQELFASF